MIATGRYNVSITNSQQLAITKRKKSYHTYNIYAHTGLVKA